MTIFEIHIPGAEPALRVQRVKAVHWFDAVERCLRQAGQAPLSSDAECHVNTDASMTVEDHSHGRAFRVRTIDASAPRSFPTPDLPDPFGSIEAESHFVRGAVFKSRETLGYESLSAPPTPLPDPLADLSGQICRGLAGGRDICGRLDGLLEALAPQIHSAASALLLIDPNDRCFYFASARGRWRDTALRRRLPLESGLLARCLRSRRPLNVRDPLTAPGQMGELERLLDTRPEGALIAPIMDDHRLYGVILLLDGPASTDGSRYFSAENASLARLVGRDLGAHLARLLPPDSVTA